MTVDPSGRGVAVEGGGPVDFSRVAVLNRGEPALRFLRALREYDAERGTRIEAVAFFTDPDAAAPFVRLADDAVSLGPPLRSGPGGEPVSAYCDHDHVLAALRAARCDAVWPGWGFVSEDAAFVERLEEAGIVFIGPPSGAMRRLGDKIAAKRLAEEAGVPLAPWWPIPPDADGADIAAAADRIGYPLMVKASAGGGGRGIRRVDEPSRLLAAVDAVRGEVARVFGAGGVLLEACVAEARHVEVQIVGGADGRCAALGVRDCTIQRRHQKIVEETPSPVLPPAVAAELEEASVRLAEAAGYRGAGTAEFLYRPATGRAAFLEVNSRLQVEHTVTEMVTGCDLVKAQIDVARGRPWERPAERPGGHAIEVRLNAEDVEQGFRPSPGIVRVFRAPAGPGVRVDAGVAEGMAIAPQFDSMVAKIIAWGATRAQALARLTRALGELEIVVEDGATNKAFLADLIRHRAVVDGTVHTGWLDRAMAEGELAPPSRPFEALIVAAVLEYRRQRQTDGQRFFAQVQDGIPQHLPAPEGVPVELRLRGRARTPRVFGVGADRYLVELDGALHPVALDATGDHSAVLHLGHRRHRVLFAYGRGGIAVEVDGAAHTVERASGGTVRAPAPAMVAHVAVRPGDRVRQGDVLCTVEAMKMELSLFAPEPGVVKAVLCDANQQVTAGQPLVLLEPQARTDAEDRTPLPEERAPAPPPRPLDRLFPGGEPCPDRMDAMSEAEAAEVLADVIGAAESILLGFDVAPSEADRLARLFDRDGELADLRHPERWAPVAGLLGAFADIESLFDRNLLPLPGEAAAVSAELAFYEFCRRHPEGEAAVQEGFRPLLARALARYGVHGFEPGEALRGALWRMACAHAHGALRHRLCSSILRVVMALHAAGVHFERDLGLRDTLERVAAVARPAYRFLEDNARQAAYVLFEQPRFLQQRRLVSVMLDRLLREARPGDGAIEAIARSPHSVLSLLLARRPDEAVAEASLRRLYAGRQTAGYEARRIDGGWLARFRVVDEAGLPVTGLVCEAAGLAAGLEAARAAGTRLEIVVCGEGDEAEGAVAAALPALRTERVTLTWRDRGGRVRHRTWSVDPATWTRRGGEPPRPAQGRLAPVPLLRDIHPEVARRIALWRLSEFDLERLDAPEQIHAFLGRARENPRDERVFVFAEVRDGPLRRADVDRDEHLWELEHAFFEALRVIRDVQSRRAPGERLHGNRIVLHLRPVVRLTAADVVRIARRLEAPTRGLGLARVDLHARVADPIAPGGARETVFAVDRPGRHRLEVREGPPRDVPIRAMSPYRMRAVRARRLGCVYPYEIVRMLEGNAEDFATPHPDIARGRFTEYDLDGRGALAPVDRPYGQNRAGVVVGVVSNRTARYPEGMERVFIASDPTRAMGALAEPECRRIIAALDLAERRGLPVEWIAVSAGARIAMDSGTENLDWTARVLRRIVEHTQRGGVVHVIVPGVNVGAQSYWNAEATMLVHTRGALIMTADGSMVLTGKKALEYSGGVSAEDERGIGGVARIMGPNGEAQYVARDLGEAYALLFEHYRFTYRKPGEPGPRPHPTTDPADRNVLDFPYRAENGEPFETIGDLFDPATNPDRKKPFAIRAVMDAVIDRDGGRLERWALMRHAETAVVWDAHLGGRAVCLIGIESRPLPRRGRVPLDGPETWTGGTLFPQSSKKVARALNAASGNRPVVVLANLSGFDGSPESLRKLQLELGAEIGRAVVNFEGRIVFAVIGRYHGGAYVVFSKALNPNLTALAVEGSYASVIGGAPAAAVVFPREVRHRTHEDPRVKQARAALDQAPPSARPRLREAYDTLVAKVLLEKQGEVAREFDAIHTVERAVRVGSLDAVIPPARLRPALIAALR